jgi:hypothetical protein
MHTTITISLKNYHEIKRVITKSHDREAGVRFVITSLNPMIKYDWLAEVSTLM